MPVRQTCGGEQIAQSRYFKNIGEFMSGQAAIIAFSANPGFTVQHTVNGQMKLSGNYWAKAQPNSSPLAYDLFQADAKFQPVGNTIAAVFLKVDNGRVFVS